MDESHAANLTLLRRHVLVSIVVVLPWVLDSDRSAAGLMVVNKQRELHDCGPQGMRHFNAL